jgi:hypothetical protein
MNAPASSPGDLLINGALLPGLWRTGEPVVCAVERRTFAAARWGVRYANPAGGAVTQARSADVPPESAAACSVVLRGGRDVTETVFFGQRIEAAEAFGYRQRLAFAAWIFVAGEGDASIELLAATPRDVDFFDGNVNIQLRTKVSVPRGRWSRVELPLDARAFPATGLALELAIPAACFPGEVRLADLRLAAANGPAPAPRPAAIEALLAERYFQRHDSSRINSLGRVLVVNAHELHFQFTFPEMRAFPACTLPHSEDGLRVFHLEGMPQSGFRYDVTYRSRGSVIIRATKENHGLTDGFLSFVGDSAAILLDAEL